MIEVSIDTSAHVVRVEPGSHAKVVVSINTGAVLVAEQHTQDGEPRATKRRSNLTKSTILK